ncbi:hypothetical protein, variant 1 [Aphanomyces invadans]|uniref:O-GlcNAc transferase C-terminal domain-containing protein n=1 Tax=Aphanomyces invadans TaxID=157072 RepID=A0A024TAV1_9STRA|nr:hypothetical protein, variant 1 [Aphanomyces invadans]ETV91270.1 hypothetical protein, variant 1 [Aphanomyces invadans]|eukprot:XP_008880107.1 hypothetical protein, variant 1 [Aphanomyces invadans]
MQWRHVLLVLVLRIVPVECRRARQPPLHDGGNDGCTLDFGVGRLTMPCRAADFGEFVSTRAEDIRVVTAAPIHACPGLTIDAAPEMAGDDRALFVVHRGACSFADKVRQVKQWGGRYIVIVNSDNSFLRMQSPDWVDASVVAVSVRHDDGTRLIEYAQNIAAAPLSPFAITHPMSGYALCLDRIASLLQINAPRTAADTFAHCAPHTTFPPTSDDLVLPNEEIAGFYSRVAALFQASGFQFTDFVRLPMLEASYFALHCAVTPTPVVHNRLASAYLETGNFFLAAEHFVQAVRGTNDGGGAASCDAALAYFLDGNYASSLEWYSTCQTTQGAAAHHFPPLYNTPASSLRQLFATPLAAADKACLAATWPAPLDSTCCIATLDDQQRVTWTFQSPFVQFLFETYTLVGVFLDELGAFNSSLVHFTLGHHLCGPASGLHIRAATAIPIVFDSDDDMHVFLAEFASRVGRLNRTGVDADVAGNIRAEHAAYLKWTITPPTMFVGYQGVDVAHLQVAVASMYQRLYPSLARPLEMPPPPPLDTRQTKIKVGFVSSWFRVHSVGKLIQRVIETIDRNQFHVVVLAATHFFPHDTVATSTTTDAITRAIQEAADAFVVLPASQDMAMHMILQEALDVLVYPEIGMDAWMYFLAHRRLAPIQCMFWGHPITTGLPSIDYFIASEFFFADFFESNDGRRMDEMHGGATYTEQLVLFSDLSTYFSKPRALPPVDDAVAASMRATLHLPASGRIYLCPQTLMKLHVAFDQAILGLLKLDTDGHVVLLYSPKQLLWKDKVHRRLGRTLGNRLVRRVLFVATLPHDKFMQLLAIADVMIDPFPFGGGVTTLDAFAAGLPVVTLPSRQSVLQLTAGFYRYLSLSTHLIASNLDEFVAHAVAIATNSTLKLALQQTIHDRLHDRFDIPDDGPHEWNTFLANVVMSSTNGSPRFSAMVTRKDGTDLDRASSKIHRHVG